MVLALRQALLQRALSVDRHRPRLLRFCLPSQGRGTPLRRARPLRPRRLLWTLTRALLSATRNLRALSKVGCSPRGQPRVAADMVTVTLQEEVLLRPFLLRRQK